MKKIILSLILLSVSTLVLGDVSGGGGGGIGDGTTSPITPCPGILNGVTSTIPPQSSPMVISNTITMSQMNNNFGSVAAVANEANLKTINIIDFGAIQNCVTGVGVTCDSSAALQAAIDAIGLCSGVIQISSGPWVINTAPSYSNLNISFNIDPNATFSGTGNFPRSLSSTNIQPISSLNNYAPTLTPPLNGGYTGAMYELTEGPGTTGWDSAVFISGILDSSSNTPTYGGVDALHINSVATTGSTGKLYGVGINHKINSTLLTDDAALNLITSGTYNSANGIKLHSVSTGKFTNGISTTTNDISSTGNFLRLTNPSGSTNLFNVDSNGAVHLNVVAGPDASGALVLGSSTSTTATTTSGGAIVPTLAAKYLIIYIGTIPYKIPLYAQ